MTRREHVGAHLQDKDTFIHCCEQSYLVGASRPTHAGPDCCTMLLLRLIGHGIRPRT